MKSTVLIPKYMCFVCAESAYKTVIAWYIYRAELAHAYNRSTHNSELILLP